MSDHETYDEAQEAAMVDAYMQTNGIEHPQEAKDPSLPAHPVSTGRGP